MKKLGFIGMGNMSGAIARGLIHSGFLKGEEMIAYDINRAQLEKMTKYHMTFAENSFDVVMQSEFVFMGVKPQVVEEVICSLKDFLKNKALISIVLGYDFQKYTKLLDASTRHVFVMPNTPSQVLQGMSLIEATHSLRDEEIRFVEDMFKAIGKVERVPSHLMASAGTLSGCGPAFVYMMIEALADGAVKEGVPREMAYALASQVMIGAATMQQQTQLHPGILKDQVCSPGGSTICGVQALEDGHLRATLIKAIEAAVHYQTKS